jgi:hypothetical protein
MTAAQRERLREREQRERERQHQELMNTYFHALSTRAIAESLGAVAVKAEKEAEVEAWLPLALSAAGRLLEALLGNPDTSKVFVEQGGVDLLLKLYLLPKLSVSIWVGLN